MANLDVNEVNGEKSFVKAALEYTYDSFECLFSLVNIELSLGSFVRFFEWCLVVEFIVRVVN